MAYGFCQHGQGRDTTKLQQVSFDAVEMAHVPCQCRTRKRLSSLAAARERDQSMSSAKSNASRAQPDKGCCDQSRW
eukprot:464964-Rhodomonas_salina.1